MADMDVPTPNTMELPEYNETKSASPPSGSSARFFDVAPDSRTVFPSKNIGTEATTTTSTAKASQKTKGVYSHDPILDQNPDELWRFLVSNLAPPRLVVSLSGTHTETKTTTSMSTGTGTDAGQMNLTTTTETVTDFSMLIDVSGLVCEWSQILAHPASSSRTAVAPLQEPGAPLGPTVRETLEEYTSSTNVFKEFWMRKLVLWDYERVTKLLVDLVRSTGYGHSIDVKFLPENYKVVVLASNEYSRAAHSTAVRWACWLSCLCVVSWPAWAMARKRMKNRLTCEYKCSESADEFFSRNSAMIQLAVTERRKQETMVAL